MRRESSLEKGMARKTGPGRNSRKRGRKKEEMKEKCLVRKTKIL